MINVDCVIHPLGDSANDDIVPTPLLVSRYYRAPEIVLGLKYSYPLDMFSFGCSLYEFATGKPLLESESINDHVRLILEISGAFPRKMLQSGAFTAEHFDETYRYFLHQKTDSATGKVCSNW